ncbi:GIY-YIG nuclease family protein [Anaerotignum propionicum]|uniref:GIY-YIG nuclease family protein n=1 Tax=Anaerotignum propionicum TaxID=28446 RepID=UPI00210E0579|nr:GIY-YIG nuclease family protein [Anaerotignum propionicum]MCQ4936783.1 GIY-YIG nuclease family protein [Anaerotignum propionicum]
MQKTITYLYPDKKNASNLKMYQDRTNQIKAFYFTRESYKKVYELPCSLNYAIYFLFNDSEDESVAYIGQSVNGIQRIEEHVRRKDFWTYGILFVTDNNSFDKLSIDYLEYEFIQRFKKSSYVLTNKDLRLNKPNISVYDIPNIEAFITQIKFLLSAEGIDIDEQQDRNEVMKYYYPPTKHNAKLFVKDGKFILAAGSEIKRPLESTKDWKDKNHYKKGNAIIDSYVENEKVKELNGKLITQVNLAFKAPSAPANLITGLSENGWKFFKELEEIRGK